MPNNPDLASVIARAKDARAAQDKLRKAMAAVAADTRPAPAPAPGQPSKP